jgi:hypothetical protein
MVVLMLIAMRNSNFTNVEMNSLISEIFCKLFSARRPCFELGSNHVRFVVEKGAMEQFSFHCQYQSANTSY